MHIILTRSVQHIRSMLALPLLDYMVTVMADGELSLSLNEDVKGKHVVVLVSTQAPAENILELLLLLDTLTQAQALSIRLFFTYFGYARDARSARVICAMLNQYDIKSIHIMHVHAPEMLRSFLNFTHGIDYDFFYDAAQHEDVIVAPDKGAYTLAHTIAKKTGKSFVGLHKKRLSHQAVSIQDIAVDLHGKRVLIVDDIVVTGSTLMQAAEVLKKAGVSQISAAVTHGLATTQVYSILLGLFNQITVTNTVFQNNPTGLQVWNSCEQVQRAITDSI